MKRVIIEFNGDDNEAVELIESKGYKIIHVATHTNTEQGSIVQAWREAFVSVKDAMQFIRTA